MSTNKPTPAEREALINRDIFGAHPTEASWTVYPKWFFDLERAGLGFHLDDDPFDIVEGSKSERVFTDEEAAAIKKRMDYIFEKCDPWENYPMPDMVDRFLASHRCLTVDEALKELGLHDIEELTMDEDSTETHCHIYEGGAYLTEDRKAGTFHLFIERSMWTAETREELEGFLFVWWANECVTNTDKNGDAPKFTIEWREGYEPTTKHFAPLSTFDEWDGIGECDADWFTNGHPRDLEVGGVTEYRVMAEVIIVTRTK